MREIYPYYDRELAYMREMAGEFAKNYPEVAGRLDLERHQCDDPHVERLIEAFCLIAARIHQRLDSEFPEISQALLNLVYPAYLRIMPSLSIVQFRIDPHRSALSNLISVPAGEQLTFGDACEFRTCYPVELWPVTVNQAALLDASDFPAWVAKRNVCGGILLRLSAGESFGTLKSLRHLRFSLRGAGHAPYTLYELLFNHVSAVMIYDPETPSREALQLPANSISAVGFEDNESLLPCDGTGFFAFRLLQEYLAFPEKFLFFDLAGLQALSERNFKKEADILFLLDSNCAKDDRFRHLQFSMSADIFGLGCTPVVNLFRGTAEPIRVDQRKSEYQIQPDMYRPDATEVFSIDSVRGRGFLTKSVRTYKPLFSFQHYSAAINPQQVFWCATRRASRRKGDAGTEVFLSLVDLDLEPNSELDETLLVETTCTNRDLPLDLDVTFDFTEDSRLRDARVQWRLLQRPSRPLRPLLDGKLDWRLISLLGMNYLGLSDSEDLPSSSAASSLKELLALLDFSDNAAARDRINTIRSIRSTPSRARVRMQRAGQTVPVYCHGLSLKADFDDETLGTTGPFVFAAVLERFFAQYSSLNSFTQLTATTRRGSKVLKEWQPRAGKQVLL